MSCYEHDLKWKMFTPMVLCYVIPFSVSQCVCLLETPAVLSFTGKSWWRSCICSQRLQTYYSKPTVDRPSGPLAASERRGRDNRGGRMDPGVVPEAEKQSCYRIAPQGLQTTRASGCFSWIYFSPWLLYKACCSAFPYLYFLQRHWFKKELWDK